MSPPRLRLERDNEIDLFDESCLRASYIYIYIFLVHSSLSLSLCIYIYICLIASHFTLNRCIHAIYWLYVWKQHDSFLEDYFWEPGEGQCIAKDKRFRLNGYSAEKTKTLVLEIRSSQTMAGRPSESTPTPHILPAWKCYFLEWYLYEKQIRGKPFATRVCSFASTSLWKPVTLLAPLAPKMLFDTRTRRWKGTILQMISLCPGPPQTLVDFLHTDDTLPPTESWIAKAGLLPLDSPSSFFKLVCVCCWLRYVQNCYPAFLTCDLVTCVSNWCQWVLNWCQWVLSVWFALRWP